MGFKDEENENSAQETLGLAEKVESVKVESYMQHQKSLYFANETFDDRPQKVQEASWAFEHYYKHLREFLAMETLEQKKSSIVSVTYSL